MFMYKKAGIYTLGGVNLIINKFNLGYHKLPNYLKERTALI